MSESANAIEEVTAAELEALRRDAARYRWLRANGRADEKHASRAVLPRGGRKATVAFRYWTEPEELDATIDGELRTSPAGDDN